jgi:hypothetical protein
MLKKISLRRQPKSLLNPLPSRPGHKGRFAIVTDVGMGCGGRGGGARRAALINLRQGFGGTGTRSAGRLWRKAFADGEVVWS